MLDKIYGADGEREALQPGRVHRLQENRSRATRIRSTSARRYVERQNLTMRMSMRRFTRLTNAFSKKIENHMAAVALYFMWYNFGRVHQTLARDASDGSGRQRITSGASRKSCLS